MLYDDGDQRNEPLNHPQLAWRMLAPAGMAKRPAPSGGGGAGGGAERTRVSRRRLGEKAGPGISIVAKADVDIARQAARARPEEGKERAVPVISFWLTPQRQRAYVSAHVTAIT